MTTPDPMQAVMRLGRDIDRLARRVDAVSRQADGVTPRLDEIAEQVTTLVEAIDLLSGPKGVQPPVTSWLDLSPEEEAEARSRLLDLAGWLSYVYLRYADAALPSCWAFHPDVVEQLWWLRQLYDCSYHRRGASWAKVADWQQRFRPFVVRWITETHGNCELGRHDPVRGDVPGPTAPEVPLSAHLDEVARCWTDRREPPIPSPQALVDAQRYDHGADAPPWGADSLG